MSFCFVGAKETLPTQLNQSGYDGVVLGQNSELSEPSTSHVE